MMQFWLITLHAHALFFLLFTLLIECVCVCVSFSSLWHPKRLSHPVILFLILLLVLLFLLTSGSMIWIVESNLRRNFLDRMFMQNVKSFCLTFQTLWYRDHLDYMDESFYMNNKLLVLTCLYRIFTPTYKLLIPLYPVLLH